MLGDRLEPTLGEEGVGRLTLGLEKRPVGFLRSPNTQIGQFPLSRVRSTPFSWLLPTAPAILSPISSSVC